MSTLLLRLAGPVQSWGLIQNLKFAGRKMHLQKWSDRTVGSSFGNSKKRRHQQFKPAETGSQDGSGRKTFKGFSYSP